jgi:hypothetical protein
VQVRLLLYPTHGVKDGAVISAQAQRNLRYRTAAAMQQVARELPGDCNVALPITLFQSCLADVQIQTCLGDNAIRWFYNRLC